MQSSKPPTTKRQCHSSPSKKGTPSVEVKAEVKTEVEEEESSSESSGTPDSSADSSTSSEASDTSDTEASEKPSHQAPPELSDKQATLLIMGATSTVAEATTAALHKYPASSLAPQPSTLVCRDAEGPPPPGVASAATAFVLGTEDMLPLEMEPPPPFPEHAKSSSKKCKKQQD